MTFVPLVVKLLSPLAPIAVRLAAMPSLAKGLAASLFALFIAVMYVWFDQGLLGIWQAYQAGLINAYLAAVVAGVVVAVCAAHAWLFSRTYRWMAHS